MNFNVSYRVSYRWYILDFLYYSLLSRHLLREEITYLISIVRLSDMGINQKTHKNQKTVCGVQRTGYTNKTRKFENIENTLFRGR